MKLKKPPIVEMWVEFKFVKPTDNWVQPAMEFLKECEAEYPEAQITGEDKLEFREISPKKLPEVTARKSSVKHLRARDEQGSKFLQLTPSQLVCTFLRLGQDYTGFRALSRDAVEKLEHYIRVCNPANLESISIHYVDIVEVPVPPSGEIELGDYFTLGLDLPKDIFGHQIAYLVRTALAPMDGTGILDIQLQMDGVDPELQVFRFRLDWHKICPYDGETDLERVKSVLSWGHQSVLKCFRSSFTDRTWALFEPEETQ